MPELRPYHIFISHAWKYGDDYNRLVRLLDSAANFQYLNYSAPKDKPLHNLDTTSAGTVLEIRSAIDRKIRTCSCILVISGMYYNNRRWMQYELESAYQMGKSIIAIRPYGSSDVPLGVQRYADTIVGWNTDSIVAAIRKYSL
ncbi:MAG: TIR domain-containing protein [Oscillospiraceae bacterium]|nr:TIR domain-containing protein [Oscillospiraceae bacterium]